ncbi:unnamed protein product [Rotaria sp. Silwood1]|nr:unnamed protein product [Rotaria sp. Silwood1]CAF4981088.1 unnamed protein product [Rotaria sp. Silwood1]CAF5015999.1 unnamed protein product [Rotaria sp. Silwood1]CAF5023881.1 unnamed protein product [Rotaria sp. Silwood1]CAF5117307.1 unnamed protein product [Rotaria sp. Silwood1]
MAQNMTSFKSNRFVSDDVSEFQQANRSPIYGYQHLPVMTLEQTVQELVLSVPGLTNYVALAKENCNRTSSLLTWDESAAIYLYSMQTSFFPMLNKALRDEKRQLLKPWFAFLKLFLTALEKLPSFNGTVWRGVSGDIDSNFANNSVQTWWSVNSCSKDTKVTEAFVGEKGVLFVIKVMHGKDISAYSAIQSEQEVIIVPGTRLCVKSDSFNFIGLLLIVYLEEEPLSNQHIQW